MVLEGDASSATRDGVSDGGGEGMKVFVPARRVEAPALSEEEIERLIEGRYVEGEFRLEEGDVFSLCRDGRRFDILCYRMMDGGRSRVRKCSV